MSLLLLLLAAGCSDDKARPPYALEGSAAGSPCERAGFRCTPGGVGGCAEGTTSAGKPLGCAGEGALCCMNATDGGAAREAGADASDAGDAGDATAD